MARVIRGLRAGVRVAFSMGALLHANQRDLHRRTFLGAVRMVERTNDQRSHVRACAGESVPREHAGDARDSRSAAQRDLHSERVVGIFSPGAAFMPGACGLSQLEALSFARSAV